MEQIFAPGSPEELAAALQSAAEKRQSIRIDGASSKAGMAGAVSPADTVISTRGLNRILEYDPRDLTISVEAGLPWAELTRVLAAERQMVPIDPPFSDSATVGGVISANTSGPRRRLYGGVRDMVIGMKFATLEGKIVQSGGMVVKNVAGLDMAKLMIGSFGTLAAVAVVNFKLTPISRATRSFMMRFQTAQAAIEARDKVMAGVLQPSAIDVLNDAAASRLGSSGFVLLVQAAGVPDVLDRYQSELPGDVTPVDGGLEERLWTSIREYTPQYLREHPRGLVTRVSTTLTGLPHVLEMHGGPVVARAANAVAYLYSPEPRPLGANGLRWAVEFAPDDVKAGMELWPGPGSDFVVMKNIKALFDPHGLLNRGRLYGRI
jgi:glycolate oxidase FAD binding subunit